jgi:hypothetical protein
MTTTNANQPQGSAQSAVRTLIDYHIESVLDRGFVPDLVRAKAETAVLNSIGTIIADVITEEWLSKACFKVKRGRKKTKKTIKSGAA